MQNHTITFRNSPPVDHQSNGAAENAVGILQAHVRAAARHIESRYQISLKPSDQIFHWLVRHAAWCHNRFGSDLAKTEHYLTNGVAYQGQVAELGEVAMARADDASPKLGCRWRKGVRLGKGDMTEQHLVSTPLGIYKARTVRRLPAASCWDKEVFLQVRGLPWEPVPKDKRLELNDIAIPVPQIEDIQDDDGNHSVSSSTSSTPGGVREAAADRHTAATGSRSGR
jgi:hypothetical protein